MERFENVLLAAAPGHLDTAILADAIRFARRNHAHLTLLDVVAPLPPWRRSVDVEGRVIDLEALLLQDRRDRIVHMVDAVGGGEGIEVEATTGEPFVEVIRSVMRRGCDLVIVGEPEHTRERHPGISAGVLKLLRKCPVPVWAMRPRGERELKVLALVDPDPTDPVRDGLNDLVLDLAVAFVRDSGGQLHVAHAWGLEGEATLRHSEFVALPNEQVDLMVQITATEHQHRLDALTARHGIDQLGGIVHLVPGEPGRVLPEFAAELGATTIVMGTVARTGLAGLIMGNTAETVLRAVACSVLAVKPEGFETPVRLDA